jgi:hypothetical protein
MATSEQRVVGALLMGGTTIMGKPVKLIWPEGLPDGMTEEELRALGRQWAAEATPQVQVH